MQFDIRYSRLLKNETKKSSTLTARNRGLPGVGGPSRTGIPGYNHVLAISRARSRNS
jgi:hypothetical protein